MVKRRLTKDDIAESSEGMNVMINEMNDSESNMKSSQKRSRSFSSQEPDLKFETNLNNNPRNHILSSASNSSGSVHQRDGKSPATLKYLSKGFNSLADAPINLTNLKSILADEIKAQSVRMRTESGASLKLKGANPDPFERVSKNIHYEKVRKL